MKTILLLPLLALLLPGRATAQSPGPTTDTNRPQLHTIRVETAPKIDGALDEACWHSAPAATNFITFAPTFGQAAAERTEVRIVYTDEAVYVGAYLYMRDASKIRTDLSRRDNSSSADQFHVGFDTYHDRQNAFRFEVTASGVQRDLRMSPPNIFDAAWDAVWDARVKIQADGWSAEMRIPFSALRFPGKPDQVWGLQFARQIQYANEFSTWSPVDPNGGGSLPQWGDLNGLQQLDPPSRLAFSPYLAGTVQRSPVSTAPVEYANSQSLSGGVDVKWGLSESFTLDATLIPNFGEAQSDNTVRNLSPFEVQYEERRQFFTEGTELFNKGNIFYSRRIGGRPEGFFAAADGLLDEEILEKNPSVTPLYNATKLSGRTKSKLGIGVLNALAAPTSAVIKNTQTGETRTLETSPLSNYNVLVIDQLLPNNSALGFTNTSVWRAGSTRDANVSALTWNLRDKTNTYEFEGAGRLSQVFELQQRETGYFYNVALRKVSGTWSGLVQFAAADDRFDQRDLGLNRRNNFLSQVLKVSYGDYQPKGQRLFTFVEVAVENTFLNFPRRWEALELSAYGETRLKNQLTLALFALSQPLWYYDYFEPRVWGKKFHHAPFVFVSPQLTTDVRKRLFCSFELNFGESPIPKDAFVGLTVTPTWIASKHLRLTGSWSLSKDYTNFGAVNYTNPDDIIFGKRRITVFDNILSAEYLFTPRMSATIRGRHYWSKLYYLEYLHLNDDGSFSASDWQGNADENFNLFNIDLVYTWQFAPGSFLNLIWKDAVFAGDDIRQDGYFRNFRKTMQAPQDNSLTLKLIYWLDAARLRHRKV
ncbi:MAG: carbohydrate binding family 9 domain-containing protein [Saprospiraceae bacterium]|nr:carbohydrate binding family 9 domain-containing protein [Saprospiraceae bacterium]